MATASIAAAIGEEAADRVLVIPPRFCGPPGSGNGGYVAGRLAELAGLPGAVEVTLRRPAPLATPLAVSRSSSDPQPTWTLSAHGEVVAEARPCPAALARPELEPPARPVLAEVVAGAPRAEHPMPGCFSCGPARTPGDGLRFAPAPVRGADGVQAVPWTPPAEFADARGAVDPAIVWAALDCPGYFAVARGGPLRRMLLGRITAAVEAPVRAGRPHAVVAWPLASSGRRHGAATALVDAGGRVCARSLQVWIEPRTS